MLFNFHKQNEQSNQSQDQQIDYEDDWGDCGGYETDDAPEVENLKLSPVQQILKSVSEPKKNKEFVFEDCVKLMKDF